MMKRLKYLTLAALVAFAACDEGGTTAPPEPAVGTVSGSVTAEGEGVAGVTVTLVGEASQSVTTGANGSFSFTNVVEGNYVVSISSIPADYVFPTTSQTASITSDGQTVQVSFSGQVVRTASIAGQVTAGGTGVEGATVSITGPEGTEDRQTGSAGNFSFTGLRAGDYTVEITNPDPEIFSFPTTSQSVTLEAGESEVVNFGGVRTLPGSISGMVTASGEGVEGATVSIDGPETASKATAADGSYQFTQLTPGTYVVTLTNPDEETYLFETLEQTVELGSDEAEVVNFGGTIIAEPEVSIEAITSAETGNAVDPDSVVGRVEVDVNVDRNGVELAAIQLLVTDGTDVYFIDEQTFAVGAPLAQQDENDEEDVTFSWNSDLIRNVDGSKPSIGVGDSPAGPFEAIAADAMRPYHPIFLNGDWQIWARAVPAPGQNADPVNAIRTVTTVNEDAVNLGVRADNDDWINPFVDEGAQNAPFFPEFIIKPETGLRWLSGDIYVTVYPIIYSAPFDPNNPLLQRASFAWNGFEGGVDTNYGGFELTEPEDNGTFVFIFCESGGSTPTAGVGSCYDDIDQVNTGFIGARDLNLITKTSFGQFGPTLANLKALRFFDVDLQSGTGVLNDILRVDNEDPDPAYFDKLDHPANALVGVDNFSRSTANGTNNLGWVNWQDRIDDLFNRTGSDDTRFTSPGNFTGPGGETLAPGDDLDGIGLPDDFDYQIYISGPDNTLGSPGAIVGAFLNPANNDFGGITGEIVGADLPPETDSPGLTDNCPEQVCSEDGTPYSDTETDYAMAGIHWDRFGNFQESGLINNTVADVQAQQVPGPAAYLLLGVDGRPPIYSNAAGTTDPQNGLDLVDPTVEGTIYNTYDDDFWDLDLINDATFGNAVWNSTTMGSGAFITGKLRGAYEGYTTDRGNGFSGVAGVVVEDWESRCASGSLACTPFDQMDTRYGFTLQPTGTGGATTVLRFVFDGELDIDPNGSDTFRDVAEAGRLAVHPVAANPPNFHAYVATMSAPFFYDGYLDHQMWTWDRAGNFYIDMAPTENIADHTRPDVGNVQMPTVVEFDLDVAYSFFGENLDQVDLKKTDFTFDFNGILSLQVYADPAVTDPTLATPPVDKDGTPYEETSLQLPLKNVAHTAFGSQDIFRGGDLEINTEFLGCLVRGDAFGLATQISQTDPGGTLGDSDANWTGSARVHLPRGPRWRTWDHSSAYGLVNTQFNTFVQSSVPDCADPADIASGFVPALGTVGNGPDGSPGGGDDGAGDDGIFGTADDDAGWNFITENNVPKLIFKGPAANFVPNIDPNEDVLVYYLDTAGRAQLLDNSAFSLIVTDVGTGPFGRWYEYTLTNPAPEDLIDNANAPANGTVDGWFVVVRGNSVNGLTGHGVIWDETSNPDGVVPTDALPTDGTVTATPGGNNGLFSFTAVEDEGYLIQANAATDITLKVNPVNNQNVEADGEFIGLSEHEFVGFVAPAATEILVNTGMTTGDVNAQVCAVTDATLGTEVNLVLDEATDCNVEPAGFGTPPALNAQYLTIDLAAGSSYTFVIDTDGGAGDLQDPAAILLSPDGLPVDGVDDNGTASPDETFTYPVPAQAGGQYVLIVHGGASVADDDGDVNVTITQN